MQLLKQSTAVTLKMGPALDATDGVTPEIGLTPTVEVSKNNGAFAARNSTTAISHDADGWYNVPLDATDTNTLGRLIVKFDDPATHLPVWHEFLVVSANVYDSLVLGTDKLEADVAQWRGAQPASLIDTDKLSVSVQHKRSDLDLTTTEKNSVNAQVDQALADYDPPTHAELQARTLLAADYATAANQAAIAGYIDTEVEAIKAVTDKLNTAMELDGAVYRFTVNALELAPYSDATAANQQTIITHLTGIKGATWNSATDTLELIRDKIGDVETDTQDLQTQIGTAGAGLTNIGDARLANLDAAVSSRLPTASYTAPDNDTISAIQAVLAGITSLANWLRAGLRKSAPDATALSEINSGGGTYDATTDSQEADSERTALIAKLLQADLVIDTSVSPWALVWIEKDTGALGVGTELLRQPLRDVDGSPITNTTTVIGQVGL